MYTIPPSSSSELITYHHHTRATINAASVRVRAEENFHIPCRAEHGEEYLIQKDGKCSIDREPGLFFVEENTGTLIKLPDDDDDDDEDMMRDLKGDTMKVFGRYFG